MSKNVVVIGSGFGGLAAAVREGSIGPGDLVVLWHSGGVPGLFGHADLGA